MTLKIRFLIMTSNLGSDILLDGTDENGVISDDAKKKVNELLKASFKPEFLNRIDDVITFTPLTKADIEKIVQKLINELSQRTKAQDIKLSISDEAKRWIANNGYEPQYGARPLQRYVTNVVETPLARMIVADEIKPHSEVHINLDGDKLTFTPEQLSPDTQI